MKRFVAIVVLINLFWVQMPAQQEQQAFAGSSASIGDRFQRYRHYTMKDGLPNNTIRDFAQDEKGFLWIATEEGLSRFDGAVFTNFFSEGDTTGLPSNLLTCLALLPGNRLLIGASKGLCVLDLDGMRFQNVSLPLRQEFAGGDKLVYKILTDHQGRVWVGAQSAIYCLDSKDLHCKQVFYRDDTENPAKRNHFFVLHFLELPDGSILFNGQVANPLHYSYRIIDPLKNKIDYLNKIRPELSFLDSAKNENQIVVQNNEILFINTEPSDPVSLGRYDWNSRHLSTLLKKQRFFNNIKTSTYQRMAALPDSLILMQSYFGKPLIFDRASGRVDTLDHWKTSSPDGKMANIFTDREGNVWAAPRFDGLFYYAMKPLPAKPIILVNTFQQTQHYALEWFPFFGKVTRGKWWFGSSNGGFYAYDMVRQKVIDVGHGKISNPTNLLAGYEDQKAWVFGTNGLWQINTNTFQYNQVHFPGKEALLDSLFIFTMFQDHKGLIWMSTFPNGVAVLDEKNNTCRHYPSKGADKVFPMSSASAIAEDGQGNMWFSLMSCPFLTRWNRQSAQFDTVYLQDNQATNASASWQLEYDPNLNCLWALSYEHLCKIELPGMKVSTLGKAQGLISNRFEGFALDRDGALWLATNNGLNAYNSKTGRVQVFTESDGLLSSVVSDVSVLDKEKNILLVSTNRGLCTFEPDKIARNAHPPLMYLTSLKASGISIPFSGKNILDLSYRQNDLFIEFTGINFFDGDRNHYQYRLDGGDDEWLEAGQQKSATYLNLQPGKYTFRVRAANGDGAWSEQEARLAFVIHPPFWNTLLFQLFIAALLGGAAWWFIQSRFRQIREREREKTRIQEQLGDLEMRALRAQMNPHFIFNALNSVQNFVLKNNVREASRYLTKFARLMRLILENSESHMVQLSREIELLRHYTELESLRFNQRFQFEFQLDSNLDIEAITIPGMLIQPHIENAIWHGLMHRETAGRLWVRFRKGDGQTLICEIEDDGVGRAMARELEKDRHGQRQSTGLSNMRQRLELLNGRAEGDIKLTILDLTDVQGHPTGTKVIVYIPYSKHGNHESLPDRR